jgi:deazaflavin-dependent oxidoreductase (nitroreductase family)
MREPEVREALSKGGVIDITTTGRKTGQARRIEIAFHNFDGRLYISGLPRAQKRSWLANLEANPQFTFHLKQDVKADLAAVARPVNDASERWQVLVKVARVWQRDDIDEMVSHSPLVEVTIVES